MKKGRRKKTIEDMHILAKNKNGKCLSTKYTYARSHLIWQCKKGHIWKAKPTNIASGTWCPKCANNIPYTIEELQKIANKKGGKCLSKENQGGNSKLEWQCANGHTWFQYATSISGKRSSWCPTCAGKNHSIDTLNAIAKLRGGKCLSKNYNLLSSYYKWQCSEKHTWRATGGSVKNNNSWCPKCHGFFKEELCRTTFEQIFETKFLKSRPKWLKSSSNFSMELDGISKKYSIAFEYQGEQHFKKNHWITDDHLLKKRILDDELKKDLCKKNGLFLIVVTYKNDLTKLPAFIKEKLKDAPLDISKFNFKKEIDFNRAYRHRSKLQEMIELAIERGGKCLSKKYIDSGIKLKWQCSKGHTWYAAPDPVKNKGHWCPKCSGREKYTIEEIQKIAKSRGGVCLSNEYKGIFSKLKFRCLNNHVWETAPSYLINQNSWCRKCSTKIYAKKRSLGIDLMKKIAKDKKGICLSTSYKNAHTKIKFSCNQGHIFEIKPMDIRARGAWCKVCKKF